MTLLLIGQGGLNAQDVHLMLPAGFREKAVGRIEAHDMILDVLRDTAIRQGGAGCAFRAVTPGEIGQPIAHHYVVITPEWTT